MTIISVTGHRTLKHPIDDVIDTFGWFLENFKPELVCTGMAVGFDQAVALACLKYNIPFEAAVPCDGQETLWPTEVQEGYRELLGAAQKVTVVSPGKYAAWKMHARNAYLVRRGNPIVAYLEPGSTSGGTAACVKVAQGTKGKQVINMFGLVGKPDLLEKMRQEAQSASVHPNKTY